MVPVISFMKYKDEAQAIEIANGTQYGLVGGIFTRDVNRALSTAREIRAGQIFVNEWFAGGVETPFGGYGKSGYWPRKRQRGIAQLCADKKHWHQTLNNKSFAAMIAPSVTSNVASARYSN